MTELHPLLREANKAKNISPELSQEKSFDEKINYSNFLDANKGTTPYLTNAINSFNRGMTQIAETPYNIINRAPQLLNLLPGEQGMGTLDEMGAEVGGPIGDLFASLGKDPLIDYMGENYPNMDVVGGINEPNPNYPKTSQFAEDLGLGVGGMGITGLAAKFAPSGTSGKIAKSMYDTIEKSPVASLFGELMASGGAAGGREVADAYELGPGGKMAAEFVGSLSPGVAAYSFPETFSRLFTREGSKESLQALDRLNIRPSVGLTGNRTGGQLESGVSALPFYSSIPEHIRTTQFDDFSNALMDASNQMRPDGSIPQFKGAGLADQVKDIAEEGLKRAKDNFSTREEKILSVIGPQSPVDVTSTRRAIEDMIPKVDPEMQAALKHELGLLDEMRITGKENGLTSKTSDILDSSGKPIQTDVPVEKTVKTDTVPYEQFRSWRTNVGRRTNQPSIKGGQSKQIYKAISGDLERAADNAGVGDDFRKLMSEQRAAYADDVRLSEGGDFPQGKKLASGQSEKSGTFLKQAYKNPDKMAYIKRNATPDEWNQLRGDIATDLGLARKGSQDATGEVISPNKFISEWNNMDDVVKDMLFDDETRSILDDIALVAADFERRGLESNTSRTAGTGLSAMSVQKIADKMNPVNVAASGVGAAAGYADPITTTSVLATTYGLVKMLMSETLGRWAGGQTPTFTGTIGARTPGAVARATTDGEDE